MRTSRPGVRFVLTLQEETAGELGPVRARVASREEQIERLARSFIGDVNLFGFDGVLWKSLAAKLKASKLGILPAEIVASIEGAVSLPTYIAPGAWHLAKAMVALLADPKASGWFYYVNGLMDWPWRVENGKPDAGGRMLAKYLAVICDRDESAREAILSFVNVELFAAIIAQSECCETDPRVVVLMKEIQVDV
jgi:hypothetical protein